MSAHRVKAWLRACLNSESVIFLEVEGVQETKDREEWRAIKSPLSQLLWAYKYWFIYCRMLPVRLVLFAK